MNRQGLIILVAAATLLLASAPSVTGQAGGTLSLSVYPDGYVHVSQTFPVSPKATSIQVSLLSAAVSDLVATDQGGSPLSYGFAGGNNVTIYTLGASSVHLGYDTNVLTSKNGTVWTLTFATAFNSTVMLPQLSTLTSAQGTPYAAPYTINKSGNAPELTLGAGVWRISYGVPFAGSTSTASASSTTTTRAGTPTPGVTDEAVGAVAAAAVVAVVLVIFRRRGAVSNRGDLRPDDIKVLDFIREKGGRVLEPEIRTRFALPKTSAWRQIKRLERMGYVKVNKIGSQNQIELLKERSA